MLKLRHEDKSAAGPPPIAPELLPSEREELDAAQAELKLKLDALKRAQEQFDPKSYEVGTAQDSVMFARRRLELMKRELRHAVLERLTVPVELR